MSADSEARQDHDFPCSTILKDESRDRISVCHYLIRRRSRFLYIQVQELSRTLESSSY